VITDATGPDGIRTALAIAVATAAEHAEDVGGIAAVLGEAADRYESLQMSASTVAHQRAAADLLATAAARLTGAHGDLQAALDDFTARDGAVAEAVAEAGNLADTAILTGGDAAAGRHAAGLQAPKAGQEAFAEDSEIDVGPGSMCPRGFNGPSVEWCDGSSTGGRVLRIVDVGNDLRAGVALSAQQIRALRDELGRALTAGAAGGIDAGVSWRPDPQGRYRVELTGDDGPPAVLSLTPAQMRAWHEQLGVDLAAEDAARATFAGVTGRLADKPRAQQYDVDAQLTLAAGGLCAEQLAASARALRLYRSGTYRAIAAHLRGDADPDETIEIRELPGDPGHEEGLAEHVAAIDQALAAAPLAEPLTVWRGLRNLGERIGVDLDADLVGATWTERSFPSTSIDPEVAAVFTDDVLLRLHVPAGVGAIQLDSRPTSREHTREAEVLLPRGLHLRVIGESEVPVGGDGTTFRDGEQHIAPPTPYRVLDVEVSMPTEAPGHGRRSGGRPPLQPDAVAVEWTGPDGPVRGRIVKRTKTTATVQWSTGRVEPGVKLNAPDLRWLTAADVEPQPAAQLHRSSEPVRLPNNGADQGLMHLDSALGELWQQLGDDRHLDVDGRALGNVVTDLGEGITLRRHDTSAALARLREVRTRVPDSPAARAIDRAIARLDAPARPAPALPPGAPEQVRRLMADLHAIPLVRRGYDAGGGEPFHETDLLAELVERWMAGRLSRMQFGQALDRLARMRHESQEGHREIGDAVTQAMRDFRQWRRPPQE
jgi:hypothetical protein